ncbi:Ion channel, partial [Teladorsagia circumcincta]
MGFITTQLPYTGRAATLRIGRTFVDSRSNANATQIIVPQMPTWKKYARIVLPHVGLILLSLLYVVGGAVAFYHMERPNEYSWTFITALFFTATLLTTIGYGNLVPVTWHGRMFCIAYALLGVPLILITVADIGKFLSENIIWLYSRYSKARKQCHRPTYAALPTKDETNREGEQLMQDARFALVNVGGKMVHVPDLMRYASVLQQ